MDRFSIRTDGVVTPIAVLPRPHLGAVVRGARNS